MQDCGNGLWTNWTDIPKDGNKPRYPAPAVTVMKNGTLIMANELASASASKSSALSTASNLGLLCVLGLITI